MGVGIQNIEKQRVKNSIKQRTAVLRVVRVGVSW
jgi:hypothetical protein